MLQLLLYITIAVLLLLLQSVCSQDLYNSTLACTRGAQMTDFAIDCMDVYTDGRSRVLSLRRVFFGATLLSRGCDRTAPYENCCVQDAEKDCVFQVDSELQDIINKCSGASFCSFSGKRLSTSVGNCDPNNYPSLTSFSFVEYNCIDNYNTTTLSSTSKTDTPSGTSRNTQTHVPTAVAPTSIFNSSLACTRGADQTNHNIDCRDHYPDGGKRALSIIKVFHGATPLSSGCNRTAPSANCCVRDPNKVDCVFQNDDQLQDIGKYCSGASSCNFPGQRVSSNSGNCDPNMYPPLTSFSFVEYQCLASEVTDEICQDVTHQQTGQVYLESNTVVVGNGVANAKCQCLITTECDSTLTFFAIVVQLTEINATACAEEISFSDVRYPELMTNVTCRNDDNVVYNQPLFTSVSNYATFNFVVTGQQEGKVYIRVESSVITDNVTLTCGAPAFQALTQIQQCPNRTTTTSSTTAAYISSSTESSTISSSPQFTSTTTVTTAPPEGPIFNSSLACTRGADQTNHNIDCQDHYPDGVKRALSIIKVFYGATPLSSGCDRTAPFANCCVRDPNKVDCVFQNDDQLQDIGKYCSGASSCNFPGQRVSSNIGSCDPNMYPPLTSFSFVEYQCLASEVTDEICQDVTHQQTGQVYLESNTVIVGNGVTNAKCQCLITTECDSTLTFFAIVVQLTEINATACAEEISFSDVRYPELMTNVTCRNDDNVVYNQPLFTSVSNYATFNFVVTGQQKGKVYIRVESSVITDNVTLTCGAPAFQALRQIQQCPNPTTTTSSTTAAYISSGTESSTISSTPQFTSTTTVTTAPPEGQTFNSSLACTRGADQTNHNIDCQDHYPDGEKRALSIIRVFYGATPLSSGCDRTAPYANCCVRDPNKVDCVFQNDDQLQDIGKYCSGASSCNFPGQRVSSNIGNCDPNMYPPLTSFSFVEYQCLASEVTDEICQDVTHQQTGQVYLESNTVIVGNGVTNAKCQCLITTECDSTLTFFAIVVQLTEINATACAEEISFSDVRYPELMTNVTCRNDDNVVYNQPLFTSVSNMATFNFVVTGQQKGKVYIRVESSVITDNVTLTCGAPAFQALTQIQQCPNRTTTTSSTTAAYISSGTESSTISSSPEFTSTTTVTTAPPEGQTFNSSLACTRGADQTNHNIDCQDYYPDGEKRALSIIRVFYGATPLSSGCDRTAPYANCCVRDPNKVDCVFQNDDQLQDIGKYCSGASSCNFPGQRVSSNIGNCDPNMYPPLTSFSFVEYQCLASEVTDEICQDVTHQQTGQVYLESNTVIVGNGVTNAKCQCLITTECDSTLTFFAIVVQLTEINATACAEEISFSDVRYPELMTNVTCRNDDNVVYNQPLFTSVSNYATFNFVVTGQQEGKVYIRVESSVITDNVTLTCGAPAFQALTQTQQCPKRTTTTSSTTAAYISSSTESSTISSTPQFTSTTTVTTAPPEGPIFNSSLACTRGADQTNHNIDCRDHYPDGEKRALSIIRVFYGATPLSSGCDRTAPYANCCVRDPNKVDCVFQNDDQLQDIGKYCSGASSCNFPGQRVSSNIGNCDPNMYPPLTSFSFVEYQCLASEVTDEICQDVTHQQTGQVYLESNTVIVGNGVTNAKCQCLITTECDSTLTFFAIVVQLTEINATACAEEISFSDVRYPELMTNVTCRNDDNVVYNQPLFTSVSNYATFNFVVTGQQKGKVYIRVESSVITDNVTLTCGAPALQALTQIQQCPNRTTTTSSTTAAYISSSTESSTISSTPEFTSTTTVTTAPPEAPIFNSSLACTRGADQTNHNIDCRDHYPDGEKRALSIIRVFYGATPLSSGCNRSAPYENCCVRDPNKVDCVFQIADQLEDITRYCSGASHCSFPGQIVSSSLGNCDPNMYPSVTSFSFVEYQCLASQVTDDICDDVIHEEQGQVYFESNTVVVGNSVPNAKCQCLITTECDSTLTFFAIVVQLTEVNATACAEEISFSDVRYPELMTNVTCRNDDNVVYNQPLFTSVSNMATFNFVVTGQQKGKVYIRVESSVITDNVTLTCGAPATQALKQIQQCPTTAAPITTTQAPEEPTFNSSLACTRGADQTYHNLDCRDHYPDGWKRALSIIRVFYGATPLSSGCNRSAPYENCCVRDPNKVDCIFQIADQLEDITRYCSGASHCNFPGQIVSSSLGKCDPNMYPSVTSFSFVEYQCLASQVTDNICDDVIHKEQGQVYFESNTVVVGNSVPNAKCQCLITTEWDSTLTFFAIVVQLTEINTTACAEEISFSDVRYPELMTNVTCRNDVKVVYNQPLFTSVSNMATFNFVVTGQQKGKVYIRVQSSGSSDKVTLTCGVPAVQALKQSERCPSPGRIMTTATALDSTSTSLKSSTISSTTPTGVISAPTEEPIFNSSLACTTDEGVSFYDINCGGHFQDGRKRELSILRVFYGATLLSSGSNMTLTNTNCSSRDPNEVDCIFPNDGVLQDMIMQCAGDSFCIYQAQRVSSTLGNCDPTLYTPMTLFTFVEYKCQVIEVTHEICQAERDPQTGVVYLESNINLVGKLVDNVQCQCFLTTECDSTLSFYAIVVELTEFNTTVCSEEIMFTDAQYPQMSANVTCKDDYKIGYEQLLFISESNMATFNLVVTAQLKGQVVIRVQSKGNVTVTCDPTSKSAQNELKNCSNSSSSTPDTTLSTNYQASTSVPNTDPVSSTVNYTPLTSSSTSTTQRNNNEDSTASLSGSSRTGVSQINTGSIVAIVFGTLAIVVIVFFAAFLFVKYRKSCRKSSSGSDQVFFVDPERNTPGSRLWSSGTWNSAN